MHGLLTMLIPGLSTLLMATTTPTLSCSFLMRLMTSRVWGMIPSSAATTRTIMSVTPAPRARIAEKAACPGVSRKVMDLRPLSLPVEGTGTEKAPIC